MPFPLLFSPISLGPIQVRNRLMMTTHGTKLSAVRYIRYLEERAQGGVGLIGIPAHFGVSSFPTGPGRVVAEYGNDFDATAQDPVSRAGIEYYDNSVIPSLRKLADAVHRHGAVCVGQVHNLGAARNTDT